MASRSAKAIVTLLAAIAFVVVVFLLVRSRHEPPSPDLPPSSVRHVYMAGGDFTRAELNVPILPVKSHALDQIRIALQSPGDRTAGSAAAEWAGRGRAADNGFDASVDVRTDFVRSGSQLFVCAYVETHQFCPLDR